MSTKGLSPEKSEKIRSIWNTICVIVNAILAAVCTASCMGL